jgi:hypothetical protein
MASHVLSVLFYSLSGASLRRHMRISVIGAAITKSKRRRGNGVRRNFAAVRLGGAARQILDNI